MDIFIALTILTAAVALAFMAGRRYEAHHAEHQDVTAALPPPLEWLPPSSTDDEPAAVELVEALAAPVPAPVPRPDRRAAFAHHDFTDEAAKVKVTGPQMLVLLRCSNAANGCWTANRPDVSVSLTVPGKPAAFLERAGLVTRTKTGARVGKRTRYYHRVQLTPLGRAVVARLRSEGITLPLLTGKV